ncbi:ABC transporter substrate-binding protein [uncultured Jatrophihabitans sp.]|uniref:ABC transporter substrate-binding protein n=1 Tax=uncultured Jatrophihabitans sp. TaxID=1610747 RepID=UPI0035C97DB5
MTSKRTRLASVCAGTALAAIALAACSSSGGGGTSKSSGGTSSSSSTGKTGGGPTTSKKGGTIYYTNGVRDVEHWDPQRVYIGRDIANESRLWNRTLEQYGTGAGASSNQVHPDLATDTGTASNDNKTWKFTLKTGVKWQDGSPVTCADVKYGVSRTFAQDIITGGPSYALQFLNIPATPNDKTFATAYHGPYTNVGGAYYDKAVTCSGQTITFNLKKSVPDFNYTVTLPAFAPFKKSQDKGAKSNYQCFSDGPYELQGTWTAGKGGTFVRNPNYDPKTDDATIRRALPDKFVFIEGLQTETVFDRLLADQGPDQYLVTDRTAPPAYLARVSAQKSRFTDPVSPFNDYLTPNFTRLKNPLIRQALAVSTDRNAWILAEGGAEVADPATGLVNPQLGAAGGYKKFAAFPGTPDSGDPAAAKKLLQQAGVKIPYPIHFTYSGGTPTSDKQASVLAAAWNKAGFKVTLQGLTNTYYDIVQNPANASKYDITWAGWGADWPSASTVIPPLFDSRVNLSSASNGSDYGLYKSDYVNAQIDKAYATADATARNAIWASLDEYLAKQVAYIPLDVIKFPRLHGSKVGNYVESASTNGYPDLGQLGAL